MIEKIDIEIARQRVKQARYKLDRAEAELRHIEDEQRLTEQQQETRDRLKWLVAQISEMDLREITRIVEERKHEPR